MAGRLEGREFLADHFSIADIAVAPTLGAAPMLGIDLGRYPAVDSWMKRMTARPAWQKIHR
jgi:glutathione S-transferase